MLSAIDICKEYVADKVATKVLRGVTTEIRAGETVAIVGASGAGKSTLLYILGGLEKPTSGQVLFEGRDLTKWSEKETNRFRNDALGFVFQFHHLLPDFSAVENVMMPLMIAGENKKGAFSKASFMLEKVGLKDRLTHKPGELSGGEQQRVAIARALVHQPKIIMADEPTGNLDVENGNKIFDLLLSLNGELKNTLVVVTHNNELAKKMSRIIQLVDGRVESK